MKELLIGWAAIGFFALSCCYSLFKRTALRNKKLNRRNLLNYHCYFAIISTILGFIHAWRNLSSIRLSTGFISLFTMLLITIIGLIMKYYKKLYVKYRAFWISIHIGLTIVFTLTILLHIISYYLIYY